MTLTAGVKGQGTTSTRSDASEEKKKEEAVVLEKYIVDTTMDRGYSSKNTLSSAGKISTRLLDTPQVIQIVNRELIEDLSADAMLGAVQMVAGGIVRRSFNPGDDQYIWGFRSGSSLKDGVTLGSNAVGAMYDVDRVEVLKGPVAMTFGNAGFIGGAINYVTRVPAKKRTTEVIGTIASFNYYRGELHHSQPVNQAFRYRVDLGATDSDYSDRKFAYYKDSFLGAGFVYDLSDRTQFNLDIAYSKINYNRSVTFIDPATFKVFAGPDNFTIDHADTKYPTENFRVTSTLRSELGSGWGLSFFLAYINNNNSWFRPYATDYSIATGIMKRVTEDFVTSSHSNITNLDFSKEWVTGPLKHTIVLGGANTFNKGSASNFSYETSDLDVRNPGNGGTASRKTGTGHTIYGAYTNSRSRQSSAYLQDTISILNDRAYLVGGLRFNDSLSDNPNAAARATALNKTVRRYGAVYKVTKDVAVHYNNSQAYIFNTGLDYLNRPLLHSLGNQEEIGVKADLFEGQMSLTATYFDITLTNVRLLFVQGPNDPIPGAQGVFQGGKQSNKGYELTGSYNKVVGAGEVSLIATYFTGNVRDQFNLKAIGATNNTGSLLAKYRIVDGRLKNFAFGAGMNSQGSRLASKFAQVPNSDFTRLPAYTEYNIFATYLHGRFRYQLNVDNLTDEIFVQGAELPFWIFTDPGRRFKFSVGYKF